MTIAKMGPTFGYYLRAHINNQIVEVFGISNLANALEREEYLNAILPMEEFEMIDFEEGEKTFNPS